MPNTRTTHVTEYPEELCEQLHADFDASQSALSPYACPDRAAVRREDEPFHIARPHFVRDTERILNCRYFNRTADKTQVFSLYRNDDITRRIQHVQIVSRTARTIGRMLGLNQDLIEAIALGHDLGHTPFGHVGERVLSDLLKDATGEPFRHNVQGVRILDRMLGFNLSLQTLDGILSHNGLPVSGDYAPEIWPEDAEGKRRFFDEKLMRAAAADTPGASLVPGTLEGCVVRFADVVAYLGKDRQDAALVGMVTWDMFEPSPLLGTTNGDILFHAVEHVVEASRGKPHLHVDEAFAAAIAHEKQINYEKIYTRQNHAELDTGIEDMFARVYERCVKDLEKGDESSVVYRHHVLNSVGGVPADERRVEDYLTDGPYRIAADYIASMTDDYFMDLHEHLFPGLAEIRYRGYFRSAFADEGARQGECE